MPWVINKLNIEESPLEKEKEKEEEMAIRLRLAGAVLEHMNNNYSEEVDNIDAYVRLKDRYERMIEIANKRLLHEEEETESAGFLPRYRQMLIELVAVRRNELQTIRKERLYSDEVLRTRERELDLEEARLNE